MNSFEFSSVDNTQFKALAQKCNLLAFPLILLGFFHLSIVIVPSLYSAIVMPPAFFIFSIVDIFALIAAYFLICASRTYSYIVRTQGSDISLLIIGNEQVKLALNCICITFFLFSVRYVLGFPLLNTIVQP